MPYLTEEDIDKFSRNIHLIPFDDGYRINDFDCGIEEYNQFLKKHAKKFKRFKISKTHLLVNKKNADIIGYITLCTDSIKLSLDEKKKHGMETVEFASIPSLKIGKLAVDKRYREKTKGYGSFLIEVSRAFVHNLNKSGIACRFITVDADIEYEKETISFYEKNGFILNELPNQSKNRTNTVSMRLEVFNDITEEIKQTGTEG